jgi:hypothetical protein
MEYWCDTEITGQRTQTETLIQRETVEHEGATDDMSLGFEADFDFGSIVSKAEEVTVEEAAATAPKQSKAKASLPKLETETLVRALVFLLSFLQSIFWFRIALLW